MSSPTMIFMVEFLGLDNLIYNVKTFPFPLVFCLTSVYIYVNYLLCRNGK